MELLHVARVVDWDAAAARYAPAALARDGFLHCCTPAQIGFVMARHFAGVSGLVLLTFESELVPGEVRWVKSEADQAPFPHLYGAIPLAAVVKVEVL